MHEFHALLKEASTPAKNGKFENCMQKALVLGGSLNDYRQLGGGVLILMHRVLAVET